MTNSSVNLQQLNQAIHSCYQCTRLREHCQTIARVKRRSFQTDDYWGKPITGFGDPNAQLMIVGLAPAAHGANRTGRIFTGDRSGEWLYRALHKAGFANQPEAVHRSDGLLLQNAYVTCVVKCAPPDNKPTPSEEANCSTYLKQEMAILKKTRVWIALGQIAFKGIWPLLQPAKRLPQFRHGAEISLGDNRWLILSYHPSQQNTFTGRLTEPMFDLVFEMSRKCLGL